MSSDEASRRRSLHDAIRLAVDENDPSVLALLLAHGGPIPMELHDTLYRLVVAAPWRDKRPGRKSATSRVDRLGIFNLYSMMAIAGNDGRTLTRQQIIDTLCHRFGVSKSTVERVLREGPKPPRVLKPKKRR